MLVMQVTPNPCHHEEICVWLDVKVNGASVVRVGDATGVVTIKCICKLVEVLL